MVRDVALSASIRSAFTHAVIELSQVFFLTAIVLQKTAGTANLLGCLRVGADSKSGTCAAHPYQRWSRAEGEGFSEIVGRSGA